MSGQRLKAALAVAPFVAAGVAGCSAAAVSQAAPASQGASIVQAKGSSPEPSGQAGRVVMIDPATGAIVWQGASLPTGNIVVINPSSGAVVWRGNAHP